MKRRFILGLLLFVFVIGGLGARSAAAQDLVAYEVYLRTAPSNGGDRVDDPVAGQVLYPHFVFDWKGPGSLNGKIVSVYLDGVEYCSYTGALDPSQPGYVWTLSCAPWTVTNGFHEFFGFVDPNGAFGETNEGNNTAYNAYQVGGCAVPGPFSLESPGLGATLDPTATSVFLSWGAAAGAVGYNVYFGLDPNPSPIGTVGSTSASVPVSAGNTYYWRVEAWNSCGYSYAPASGAWSFSVGQGTQPPIPDFAWDPITPSAGDTVTFFDLSQGSPASWHWDFGDGAVGTGSSVVYQYDIPGFYAVTLTAANPAGSASITKTVQVAPGNTSIVISGPTTGKVGQSHTFAAQATGCVPNATGWTWGTAGATVSGAANQAVITLSWPTSGLKILSASNSGCGTASGEWNVSISSDPAAAKPAAPSNLTATAVSGNEVRLTWNDNSSNEELFRIEGRNGGGAFQQLAIVPGGSVAKPSVVVGGLAANTAHTFRVKAENAAGSSAYSNEASVTTPPGVCLEDASTLCLNQGRFQVRTTYRTSGGASGTGQAVALTDETGYFWFFDPGNIEMVIKVLNGCGLGSRYWVFAGGLTNVQVDIRVTDTRSGKVKDYSNPQGAKFLPIQDTDAFAACGVSQAAELQELAEVYGVYEFETGEEALEVRTEALAVNPAFDWEPEVVVTGVPVTFTDNQGAGVSRSWNFGDGTIKTANGPSMTHTFTSAGSRTVTLTVFDNSDPLGGKQITSTRTVNVAQAQGASIQVKGPKSGSVDIELRFTASGANCNPDPKGWSWSVDGGKISGAANEAKVKVAWSAEGTKQVTARNSACTNASGVVQVAISRGGGLASCSPSSTALCLNSGRFKVEARWEKPDGSKGSGRVVPLSTDTGYLWFFNESNVETIVKVLNGCGLGNRYWVFAGGLTNVKVELTVTDTKTGKKQTYTNPQGKDFQPIQDTNAFATCP